MREATAAPEPLARLLKAFLWRWFLVLLAAGAASVLAALLLHGRLRPQLLPHFVLQAGVVGGAMAMLAIARRGLRALPMASSAKRGTWRLLGLSFVPLLFAWGVLAASLNGAAALPGSGGSGAAVVPDPTLVALGWLALLAVGVLTPVAEELFFRHLFWRRLEARGPLVTGALTSLAWIAIHLRGPAGSAVLLPLAVVLPWLRHRSGSPQSAIWVHGSYNLGVLLAPLVLKAVG